MLQATASSLQALVQEGAGGHSAYQRYSSKFQDLLFINTSSLANWSRDIQGSQAQRYGVLVTGLQQALRHLLEHPSMLQGCTTALTRLFEMPSPPLLGQACLSATCRVLAQGRLPSPAYPSIMAAVVGALTRQQDTEQAGVLYKLLSSTLESCRGLELALIFDLLQRLQLAYSSTATSVSGSLCFILHVQLLQGSSLDATNNQMLTSNLVHSWLAAAFRFCN